MTDKSRQRLQFYNAIFMVIEGAMFVVATSFLDAGTVVAVFANLKTGGNTVAGVCSALVFLCPLLGTVLMGNMINRLRRPGLAMTVFGFLSRMMIFPALLSLVFHAPDAWQVGIFVAGYGLFYLGDGLVALIWTDILVRTQPARQRMVIHSIARVFGGAIGFGVALFIKRTLASPIAVDAQFTAIFTGACVCLFINAICLALIRDDPQRVPLTTQKTPWKAYFLQLFPLLRKNPEARSTIFCKMLYQLSLMTTPLNILFCTQYGHVTQAQAATLVLMPVFGLIFGGFLWAYMIKRFGYPVVMLTSQLVSALCAVLSLISLVLAASGISVLWPMGAVILLLTCNVGAKQSYDYYVAGIVPEQERAHYLVLLGVLLAPFTLGSVVAGMIADLWGFIPVYLLFALICACGVFVTFHAFFKKEGKMTTAN